MWNLRRVAFEIRPDSAFFGPARVVEVYYEKGVPWTYSEASLLTKLRLIRDWLFTPILLYPDSFTGEPEWAADLASGAWKNWEDL